MSRVLFTSARQDGFVLPLLQLVRAMVQRGDQVWFLSGEAYRQRIEEAGAAFVRLPYDAEVPATRIRSAGSRSAVREIGEVLRALFLDTVEEDFRTVLRLHDELRLDLVVTEPLFVGAGAVGLLPRAARPAVLTIGFFPLPFSSPDVAPYGTGLPPLEGPLNAGRNRLLAAGTDLLATGRVRRAFQREIRRLTGVPVSAPLFDLPLTADAYAQTTVPQFEYPRRTLSEKVRFVGPLPPPTDFALPDWWDYTDPRRVVHVTQGTYANTDPTDLIVPTLRALADEEDLLVVATTGGPAPETIEAAHGGRLPANARVERFMPYDHLLASASVMVTNGGYGAVHHAMRWGLPLVVAGTTEEKVEVNARVAWSGVGLDLRERRPAPAVIRAAVRRVLDDSALHRRAAARLGAAIGGTDAIGSILRLADELTDPSRPATGAAPRGLSRGSSAPPRPSARRAGATP